MFQCVLGYAIAPILIASIVAFLVHNIFVRIPVTLACWGWSVWGESCNQIIHKDNMLIILSINELLQRYTASRKPNVPCRLPHLSLFLCPCVDDHHPVNLYIMSVRTEKSMHYNRECLHILNGVYEQRIQKIDGYVESLSLRSGSPSLTRSTLANSG